MKVDAFGKVRVDGGTPYRARLIQAGESAVAAFPESDPKVPILFTLTSEPKVRGRNLSAELIGGGLLEFQRAGCSCQTPSSLRGPARLFLERVPAPAET